MFGPDHLSGLRPGIRYPAWGAGGGAGAFGASPARALGRGGATVEGMRRIRPRSSIVPGPVPRSRVVFGSMSAGRPSACIARQALGRVGADGGGEKFDEVP